MKTDKKNFQNIVIRMPNWLGDFVMSLPILSLVKTRFPHAKITLMCSPSQKELLDKNFPIDHFLTFEKPKKGWFCKKTLSLIQKIKKNQFDLGILTTNSLSSALLFFFARIPNRLGYAKDFRRFFLNLVPTKCKKIHQIQKYQLLLAPLGIRFKEKILPHIFLSNKEKEKSFLFFQKSFGLKKPIVAIHADARYGQAKCWPKENFEEVAFHLVKNHPDLTLIFVGQDFFSLKNQHPRILNLLGKTNLRELAELLSHSSLLLTNDSGPMHVASAVGCPVLAIFGSTDPVLTGPFGKWDKIVCHKMACSPCFKRNCPKKHYLCMKKITSKEVENKIEAFLTSNLRSQ